MCLCRDLKFTAPFWKYNTNQREHLSRLFEFISFNFSDPSHKRTSGNIFVPVIDEQFAKRIIIFPISASTSDMVLQFIRKQSILQFGLRRMKFSDNTTYFTSAGLHNLMQNWNIYWKTVAEWYKIKKANTERVIRTMKAAIKRCDKQDKVESVCVL